MKTYGIVFVAFAAIAICVNPASASFFDIFANDDTFVKESDSINYDNQGLFVKERTTRDIFIEFTLGSEAVTEAKLRLYQTATLTTEQNLKFAGAEWTFDETVLVGSTRPNWSTWPLLAQFHSDPGSPQVGVPGGRVGWYDVDITSFYNDHLGKAISIVVWANWQANDWYGNTFEDREGSTGTTNYPRITAVPEPASLLMLVIGLVGLARVSRRSRG